MSEARWYLSVCKLNQRADLDMFRMWAVWFDKPPTRKEWRAPDAYGSCRFTKGNSDALWQAQRAWIEYQAGSPRVRLDDPIYAKHQEIESKWAAAHLRTMKGKPTWPWPRARAPRPKPGAAPGPRAQESVSPMRCFEVLELSRPYTEERIKAAYRALAFKHHPDRGGSAQKFAEVTRAKDEALRYCGVIR